MGNITNNQTFCNTYLSDDLLVGRGNGTIETSDGQKITWSSSDLGTLRDNQWVFYGVMLFNNTSNKSLSLLNNSIALSNALSKSSYHLMEPEYIWIWKNSKSNMSDQSYLDSVSIISYPTMKQALLFQLEFSKIPYY